MFVVLIVRLRFPFCYLAKLFKKIVATTEPRFEDSVRIGVVDHL